MAYQCYVLKLNSDFSATRGALLAAWLRRLPPVASALVRGNFVRIYSKMPLSSGYLQQAMRRFLQQEEKTSNKEESALDYRRDALISVGGFVALQLIKHYSPQAFESIKLLRSALVLFTARDFIKNGIIGAWQQKSLNADTLTATAVAASILSGKPESSLTLLALSNGAEMLTSYAAEGARRQISNFLQLDQNYVWRLEGGTEKKVPVDDVRPGDVISVHLGEKICIDGRVQKGRAAVGQASITGESAPAIKEKGSIVYAGSVIESGQLTVLVEKVGEDTSLAHIIHLVEQAQTRRAPIQRFADKMANMLVPVSFLGAAVVYGATRDWQRVLNLLFIDFSCGLKLSTATAVSAAIALAAKQGVLIKGGNYVEALSEVDTVVLDKTGTITIGEPQISKVCVADGVCEEEMLLLAASAEIHSVHPLAVAIQKYVREKGWQIPPHSHSETVVARGMKAVVPSFASYSGGEIIVGSEQFMRESGVQQDTSLLAGRGCNAMYVARDKKLLGFIVIDDPIRPNMKKTLNKMRRHGIDEIVMLTGDSRDVARKVAIDMGIDDFYAEVLPEDKAEHIQRLQRTSNVMMVGDGINDAPALAFADVGVTMGGRRTDLAVESAAVTVRSDNPDKLVEALRLSRRTMNIIHQNFTATLTINSAAMLLGALGKISPLWAAVIHNTATLGVVLNSVRILAKNKISLLETHNKK